MTSPPFALSFRVHLLGKRWVVIGHCNSTTGLIVTVYEGHRPIFNLVADEGAESRHIRKLQHDWWGVEWGLVSIS